MDAPSCLEFKTKLHFGAHGAVTGGVHTIKADRLELGRKLPQPLPMHNPSRYFNSSPEVIRLTVIMDIRYSLSLRQVEDVLFERGIDT